MSMDDREMKEFMKRNEGAAWIATTLCDRCKRAWPSPSEPPKLNQEWICPDCESDVDIF